MCDNHIPICAAHCAQTAAYQLAVEGPGGDGAEERLRDIKRECGQCVHCVHLTRNRAAQVAQAAGNLLDELRYEQ